MTPTKEHLTYAAITPARDEARNLPRLATALSEQTVRPVRWVIVENGSTDETYGLARRLAAKHNWITVIQTVSGRRYDRTSPYMRAFHAGVEAIGSCGDVVVKLDADVSFEPRFFEGLLAEFEHDPRLGIASGALLQNHEGSWREAILLGSHVWGPARAYRRTCLEDVLPLDDGLAYAVIDETKARLGGFTTATIRQLRFRHHRVEGAGEGPRWRAWLEDGRAAHYIDYRPSYLIARCLYRMRADPTAAALLAGYFGAFVRAEPKYGDRAVREEVRREQRARNLGPLVRARLGRPASPLAGGPRRQVAQ
jgi:glycosyltransferase involved in cell wall biosynthesis